MTHNTISGVYQITNVVNGHCYVGSAINLSQRRRDHWKTLRRDIHRNKYLQNAFNKYGEDAFVFDVLEYWEKEFLVGMEQYWMNLLRPEYNIVPVAGSSLGVRHTPETCAKYSAASKRRRHTDETKARMSESSWWHTATDKQRVDHRDKISAGQKGKAFTDEHKANIAAAGVGRKATDKARANMSAAHKGYKHTDEARANMRKAWGERRVREARA